MKKTILVSLVAVMMLFAFTACEQPVPGLSKAIIDADIVQNGTFFVGQPFDASKFSVNVTYSDGTKGTLEGVNVTTTGDADSVKNGDKVSVTLPTAAPNYSGSDVSTTSTTFKGSLVAYAFNNVEVTVAGSLAWDDDEDEFVGELGDVTVVATYKDSEGATQTVTLVKNEDYTVGTPALATEPTATENGEGAVSVNLKFGGYTGTAANAASGKFVVTAYEGPAAEYTYKWTEKIYYTVAKDTGSYVNRGLFNASDVVTLYKQMQAYDEDGVAVSPAVYTYEAIPYNNDLQVTLATGSALATTDNSIRFSDTAANATINFSYRESDETGKYKTYSAVTNGLKLNADGELEADTTQGSSITIALRDDYPTAFEASWIGAGAVSGTPYDTDGKQATVAKTDFDFSITWKSGYAADPSTLLNSITMKIEDESGTTIPADTESGSKTVSFEYSITDATDGYVDSDLTAEATITIEGPTA